MTELPDPLVPANVDLRDFQYMPLDVVRLRDSSIAVLATGDGFRAAVMLWCASWHQVPAGSVPDDDAILAQLAGYGRVIKEWRKVKADAMRGWIKCSDGRLYHQVVSEKVLESWDAKLTQRLKTENGRIKKHNERHGTSVPYYSLDEWKSLGCPSGQALPVPGDKVEVSPGQTLPVPGETHSKVSKGKGREGNSKQPLSESSVHAASSPADSQPPENATRKGALCSQLRALGISAAPHLQGWAELLPAYSDAEILAAAETAREKKPGESLHLNYLLPILRDRKSPGQAKPNGSSRNSRIDNYAAQAAEARGDHGSENRPDADARIIDAEVVRVA